MAGSNATLEALETPEASCLARVAVAREVATERARAEAMVVAALVVGSTALRRCSERADLDLVLLSPVPPSLERFAAQEVEGVRVEIERITTDEALACTAGGGWVWELRAGARLGCNIPVLDPDGWSGRLAARAGAMRPSPARVEATLRGVYLRLVEIARGVGCPQHRMDALRGCVDNLALLALLERPRRYQKAKWALADLLHAGERSLVDAVLDAYAVEDDDARAAQTVIAAAGDVVEAVYARAAIPDHAAVLAMGHTEQFAEASYVSRCLDDAEDFAASGRFLEAQYVARFAARLAVLGIGRGDAPPERYGALFPDGREPRRALLDAVLAAADARRQALGVPA